MLLELVLLLVAVFVFIYWKITRQFSFFKDLGVPYIKPIFPFGCEAFKKFTLQKIKFNDVETTILEEGPKDAKIFGFFVFGQPNFFINDMELAKRVFIKDFEYFTDRREVKNNDDILDNFLNFLTGEKWKRARSAVSGVFTSGKLKMMTEHIVKVGENFEKFIKEKAEKNEDIVLKEACGFMTLDSIATAVFGIESCSMEDPQNTFRTMTLRLTGAAGHRPHFLISILKFLFRTTAPRIAKYLNVTPLDPVAKKFFTDVIKQAYTQRMKSGTRRNDFIDLLVDEIKSSKERAGIKKPESFESDFEQDAAIDLSNIKESKETEYDMEALLVASAVSFFFAGFDTTAFGLALSLHAMAVHPEYQEKVYQEIADTFEDGDEVTFEKIQQLKYLDMFISESMRGDDNIVGQERQCTKDYKVPGTDYIIPKGRMVKIFSKDFSSDPEYFKNPKEFDPDNFLPENNHNKYAFHAFGHGPRNCVGMRYALLVIKIAVVSILRSHRLVRCDQTKDKIKVGIRTRAYEGGVIRAVPRD